MKKHQSFRPTTQQFARMAAVVAMSTALAGCAGLDLGRIGNASGSKAAERSSEKAAKALSKGQIEKSVTLAEAAVAADPNNAAHRVTLGQAYLANGRFLSAETSFADALALDNDNGRAAIGMVLALLANGKNAQAIEVLGNHRDSMNASDYGLALALAGDLDTGLQVLDMAVRQPDATARTRQNLAFAYALAGRWLEAKIIAAQDMNPANLEARMAQWSALATSATPQQRVASLLGTSPAASDAGQPARLALNSAVSGELAVASADPADRADAAEDALAQAADTAAPAPAPVAAVEAPAPAPAIQSVAVAPSFSETPLAQPASTAPLITAELSSYKSAPAAVAPVAAPRAVAPKAAAKPAPRAAGPVRVANMGNSNWVVQLGAYDSLSVAQGKWSMLGKKHNALKGFTAKGSVVQLKGRSLVRLSASGLASQKDAISLCNAVKAGGGSCFVRQMNRAENVRWVSAPASGQMRTAAAKPKARPAAKPVRVASR